MKSINKNIKWFYNRIVAIFNNTYNTYYKKKDKSGKYNINNRKLLGIEIPFKINNHNYMQEYVVKNPITDLCSFYIPVRDTNSLFGEN